MVLIPLKSQFTDLIITIFSGVAEFFLFSAALCVNKYAECHALKNGKQVKVRLHRIRTKSLGIISIVVFITLEVLLSFFSNPERSRRVEFRPCLSINRYDLRKNDLTPSLDMDKILISCTRQDGDQIFQHTGNLSRIDENDIRCSETPLFMFKEDSSIEIPIGDRRRTCNNDFGCIFTEFRSRTFYMSIALGLNDVDKVIASNIPISFYATKFFLDIDEKEQVTIAERALDAIRGAASPDSLEARRYFMLGTEEMSCPFFSFDDVTSVPLVLIYITAASWLFSLLAFLSTFLLRRHIFYDMSDPLHWAQRTFRDIDQPVPIDPVISRGYEHGEQLIYVMGSNSEGYNYPDQNQRWNLLKYFRRRQENVQDSELFPQPESI